MSDPLGFRTRLRQATARADDIRQRLAGIARTMAAVEERAAETFDTMAETRPDRRAAELRGHASHARQVARDERSEAQRYSREQGSPDDDADG